MRRLSNNPTFDELVEYVRTLPEPGPSALEQLRREPSDPVELLLPKSVTQDLLADDSVGPGQLQPDSVGSSELQADSVGASELADNSVASANIINGTIVDADLANPHLNTQRQVLNASSFLGIDAVAGIYAIGSGGAAVQSHRSGLAIPMTTVGHSAFPGVIIAAGNFTVPGKTTEMFVRGLVSTNATAPGITFTFGLRAWTVAGVADNLLFTAAAVTGNTAAVVTPAASSVVGVTSAVFAPPALGTFALWCETSAALANNAAVKLDAELVVRWA